MKESTIENNINKSINALKINELGYAKEYVNRVLVEIPDHALANKIREYIMLVKQKDYSSYCYIDDSNDDYHYYGDGEINFFISIVEYPKANEMFPLIEFFCDKFETERLNYNYSGIRIDSRDIKRLIDLIEIKNLYNNTLKRFYNSLKRAYPMAIEKEEKNEEYLQKQRAKWQREDNVKKVIKICAILGIVAVCLIFFIKCVTR